jgi:hypothetical protein
MNKRNIYMAAVVVSIVFAFQFYKSNEKSKLDSYRITEVNKDSKSAKGVIVRNESDKYNHIFVVKYHANKADYECWVTWYSNPKSLKVGDSISLRYSIKNPQLAISELEEAY